MKRDIIKPSDKSHWLKLRQSNINSTDISSLFGVSPYQTEFELAYRKAGRLADGFEENERMKWGTRLQAAIAHGVAEDLGLTVTEMDEYISLPELRLGSSFDYITNTDCIFEVKNVDFIQYRDTWIDDGINLEAPPHIEVQLQQQLLVSGKKKGYIVALVGGNNVTVIEREAHAGIHKEILTKAKRFWAMIDSGNLPDPNLIGGRDARAVIDLYQSTDDSKILLANDELTMLALEYKSMADAEKMAADQKERTKAKMLLLIGDAAKVKGNGFTISSSTVAESEISYKRNSYRSFKVNWKKPKGE